MVVRPSVAMPTVSTEPGAGPDEGRGYTGEKGRGLYGTRGGDVIEHRGLLDAASEQPDELTVSPEENRAPSS